jgi:hypothetical protein
MVNFLKRPETWVFLVKDFLDFVIINLYEKNKNNKNEWGRRVLFPKKV